MNKKKVLIITNKDDITVDFIAKELNKRQISFYRFNTEDLGTSIKVKCDLNIKSFILINNKKIHNLDHFTSVYYRRPMLPTPPSLTEGESAFFYREYETLLEGIYRFLQNKKWLNNVYDIRNTENKILQLLIANDLGFNIPKSQITNIPKSALEFIKNGDNIFKPLKNGLIEETNGTSKVLFTTKVDNYFKKNINRIESLPVYLQKLIKKKCDLRVTVVGNIINAVKIYSQDTIGAEIDWRESKEIPKHEIIKLDKKTENRISKLCKYFNLNFAAIDFAIDQNDDIYFFEINPNGQWAWIEKILNIKISKQITDFLVLN